MLFSVYSSILASNSGLKLPKFFTSENISCPVCFTPWQFNSHSFKLLPSTGKKFKIDVNSNVTDGKILKFKEFKRNGLLRLTKNKLVSFYKYYVRVNLPKNFNNFLKFKLNIQMLGRKHNYYFSLNLVNVIFLF